MAVSDLPFDVDVEFIEQNQMLNYNKTPKKGGPYNEIEREKRRNEVYRLHFEYGYSARKISELMKVNRNTINEDINFWYSKICNNHNILNPEISMIVHLERLEIQRSRLREQLDKTKTFQEKMTLEKIIYDIDCKMLHVYSRTAESARRLTDFSTERINLWLKENKKSQRYLTLFDKISVSEKALDKINQIIKKDKKNYNF